jgi:serine/threonine-protein kinase
MSKLAGRLVLNEDVLLIPVVDLPDESREQIECGVDDVAVSRLGGRSGSKIIDKDAAKLLNRFRQPCSAVEAVILFARECSLEPDSVLEAAYPMLRNMVDGGILLRVGEEDEPLGSANRFTPGTAVPGGIVTRTLQILEDTEVYLLTKPDGRQSVLKIERRVPGAGPSVRARLEREADLLVRLDGEATPRLLDRGSLDGQTYLELEFVVGVDAATAASEWRYRRDGLGQRQILALARLIGDRYAHLHRQGVLHGDVHPRNVLVAADGQVRIIDFGLGRSLIEDGGGISQTERGGIPFFFEPELALAYLADQPPPPVTTAGEQYSVAALIFFLVTGAHWQDFRLDRRGMLADIVERPVLNFTDRGVDAWPALESVLARALSKDPADRFPSMEAFAAGLGSVPEGVESIAVATRTPSRLNEVLMRVQEQSAVGGIWMTNETAAAPFASLTYGACGIAIGLHSIAQRRNDSLTLAAADVWAQRALRAIAQESAFYNVEIQITPELVGEASPYHSPSGIHAAAALIARSAADVPAQLDATTEFLNAVGRPVAGLDLTLGTASTLLGAAIVLDAATSVPGDWTVLRSFGDRTVADLWQRLDVKPAIRDADVEYLGVAHGWAGFLYATLQWTSVANTPLPSDVVRRLDELAALALPAGRGLEWPWVLHATGEPPTMAGWCNGTSGYVFLWTLAHRLLGDSKWLALAEAAAWNVWESADPAATLCCGLVGRAYALLNLFRHTGDKLWLDRARFLAERAAIDGGMPSEYPHSLYKGEFGLAVLSADLEQPEEATMPFFEPLGYSRSSQ